MTEAITTTTEGAPSPPPSITPPAPSTPTRIDAVLAEAGGDLRAACEASGLPLASFEVAVRHAARKRPELEVCTPGSLAIAILDLARLGLMPAGQDGQAALYAVEVGGELEARAMAMVNGLVDLALRSGSVLEIDANTVREGEAFRFEPTTKTLEHTPTWPRAPKIIAAYAWADTSGPDGPRRLYEVIDKADIDAARAEAHGNPAWGTHPGPMAEKTAKKRLVWRRRLLPAADVARLTEMAIEGDRLPEPGASSSARSVLMPVASSPAAPEHAGPANASRPVEEAPAAAAPEPAMSPKAAALLAKARAAKATATGAPPSKPSNPPVAAPPAPAPAPKKAAAPAPTPAKKPAPSPKRAATAKGGKKR